MAQRRRTAPFDRGDARRGPGRGQLRRRTFACARREAVAAVRPRAARAGRAPLALVIALVVGAFVWYAAQLDRAVEASGHHLVDARRVQVTGRDWVPPDWSDRIAAHLAAVEPFEAVERDALERAAASLADLPFVAEVGAVTTVWPDGLSVDLRLRAPRACVRVGERYRLVADDGVVLPGVWPMPPDTGRGRLPVLGPFDWPTDELQPGDRVHDDALTDGIAIATSMFEHLSGDDLYRLGIVLIDAREARRASVENPGVQLWLEGRRIVLFGRAPNADAPGELPVAEKWDHVRAALDLLDDPSADDWDLLDVRWDRAVLRPRLYAPPEEPGGLDGDGGASRAPSEPPRREEPRDEPRERRWGVR